MSRLRVLVLALTLVTGSSVAAPGDTTWVRTFDHDFYNWATPHDSTFTFPDGSVNYKEILIYYRLECPPAPGDCDPWDRIGYLQIRHDTGEVDSLGNPIIEPFEIARVITPYDITGGSRPETCTWVIDASDYETMLRGEVTLRNYIESWIGGNRGWIITIDFAFIEGDWLVEPIEVINLWNRYRLVSGDPSRPEEDVLVPRDVLIPEDAVAAKVKTFVTGHGQGNTSNCSEFCVRTHTVIANGSPTDYVVWRTDCAQNPCSPQGGTWQFNRAGWCPGDKADPYEVDITSVMVSGETTALDYDLSHYENFCRPSNPDCVSGQTCPDCNYNNTGHTEPHLAFQSQLVIYAQGAFTAAGESAGPGAVVRLGQNTPNPFNPVTRIEYDIPEGGRVTLVISDAGGRVVREISRRHAEGGTYQALWDGRDDSGRAVSSGAYFYVLRGAGRSEARKMVLLR